MGKSLLMSERVLQKIVVMTSLNGFDANLIGCGARLASIFKKELCLFYLASDQRQMTPEAARQQLADYRLAVQKEHPRLPVSILSGNHKPTQIPLMLANDQEAVLFVAATSSFRFFARPLRLSPVPFLFIDETQPLESHFRKIVLPVDLRPQNKDAMMWCIYFGRYNQAETVAIAANDKHQEYRRQVNSHMQQLKKHMLKFNLPHKIYKGSRSSLRVHEEGLEAAFQMGADLLILLGSSTVTWLDRLLGLPEEKIIRKAERLPVLIVNPRRETYLLCE